MHAKALDKASRARAVLKELEPLAQRLTDVLAWPAPLEDAPLGGSGALDVYLERPANGRLYQVQSDGVSLWDSTDRTSAFVRLDPALGPSCYRRALLAEAYARASLYSIDAASNEALATATAAYLAWITAPCEVALSASIDDYQGSPELAVSNPGVDQGRGAVLFPWYVQSSWGVDQGTNLLRTLWTLSAQKTPANVYPLQDKPSLVWVLGSVFRSRNSSLADVLLDYSVARAFVGDRDDGLHMPETHWLGAAGAVRFDWSVTYDSLPRSLTPAAPIEPTGASYIWVDLRSLGERPAGLGLRLQWESPSVFRVSVLRIGPNGRVLSRLDPVSPERGTELQANLEQVQGAAAILIVLSNVGSLRKDEEFDPNKMPYAPQSYVLSLFAQK